MKDNFEAREEMVAINKQLLPIFTQIDQILKGHEVGGYFSLTINDKGYLSAEYGRTGWKLQRYSGDSKPKLEFNYDEVISIGEE